MVKGIIIGFVLGLVVATVGFGGVAKILDKGVKTVITTSEELVK